MEIKQKIISYAREIKIPLLRFTSAAPFPELLELLKKRKSLNYLSGWEPKELELSCNPQVVISEASSVICAALPYNGGNSGLEFESARGIISKFSWGVDYHRVMKDKLIKLLDYLKKLVPGTEGIVCVDNGPVFDRAFAQRSGLGFYGWNNTIITREYGSWVFLGEIVTNLELVFDQPLAIDCGGCGKCLEVCPTGALVEPYCLNAQRCLSYLTQNKQDIPREFRDVMGNQVYGCDLCQDVCPWNKNISFKSEINFCWPQELKTPQLIWLLELDNKEFKQLFGASAVGWRGRTLLQRNAIIALANSGKKNAAPILWQQLNDQREVIRYYAVWALFKLLKSEAVFGLKKHLKKEKSEKIRSEVEQFLADKITN